MGIEPIFMARKPLTINGREIASALFRTIWIKYVQFDRDHRRNFENIDEIYKGLV